MFELYTIEYFNEIPIEIKNEIPKNIHMKSC